jgi:hypothetical protein
LSGYGLSGSVSVDTHFGVSGRFDYTCTRDTCGAEGDPLSTYGYFCNSKFTVRL